MVMLFAQELAVIAVLPDPGYTSFVAKVQKARTRKGKEYFILRVTIPKEVAEKIGARPDDHLFFKAKKASWYHMIDWRQMETTWGMLPPDIQREVSLAGLPTPPSPEGLAASAHIGTGSEPTYIGQGGITQGTSLYLPIFEARTGE